MQRNRVMAGNLAAAMLALVLVLSLGKATYELMRLLWFEWQGPVTDDALVYIAMGRGIQNGLTPYLDLFESKPPGIYLLMLLSLLVSGGERLAVLLQLAGLILLPVLLAVFATGESREEGRSRWWAVAVGAAGFICGSLLMLLLQARSGGLQTEAFGALFASFYALNLASRRMRGIPRGIVGALCLLGSIGMKEPFLLTSFAVTLLLTSGWRPFVRDFVVPLVVAASTGIVLLWSIGWLQPYLDFYLPAMLQGRVGMNSDEPLWLRGLRVRRLLSGETTYSPLPLLGYGLTAAWLAVPVMKVRDVPVRVRTLGLFASVATLLAMHFAYLLGKTIYILAMTDADRYAGDAFFQRLIAYYLVGATAYLILLYSLGRQSRRVALNVLTAAAALYLTVLAGGIGGYLVQHGGFTVPSYVALALVALRSLARQRHVSLAVLLGVALAGCAWWGPDERWWNRRQPELFNRSAELRTMTDQLDRLLDACGQSQYVFVGSRMITAYARHSPLGPMFMWFHHDDYLAAEHPLYQTTLATIDDRGNILVQEGGGSDGRVVEALGETRASEYTEEPPPCAASHVPIEGLRILFRAGWSAES